MSGQEPNPSWPPAQERGPTYWSQSRADDPLSPGGMIRRGWRIYRSAPRPLLVVALLPELLRGLFAIPSLVIASQAVESLFDIFADYLNRAAANPDAYGYAESTALAQELELRLQTLLVPSAEVAVASAVLGALALATSLVGASALSFAALARSSNRPVSAIEAFRAVLSRPGLVRPIVALSLASVAAAVLPILLQGSPDFRAWSGEPGSPRSLLLGSLFSVAGLVLVVGIVVLAVRWAMYIPAVLEESLGVGAGLARAATLSRGMRGRLFVMLGGLFMLQALSVGLTATLAGLTVGLSGESVQLGFITYIAISAIASFLWAPVLPAVLAMAYRTRTRPDGESRGVAS